MQEIILTHQLQKDVLLNELITKEVLLIAVGSTTYQNLTNQIEKQVLPKM